MRLPKNRYARVETVRLTRVYSIYEKQKETVFYIVYEEKKQSRADFTLFTFDSRAYILYTIHCYCEHMHVSFLSALRCVPYVWVHKCTHQRYIYVIYTYEVGLYPLYYLISHFRALYLSCSDNSVVTPSGLFCRTFTLYTFCIIYIRPRFFCSYYIHICTLGRFKIRNNSPIFLAENSVDSPFHFRNTF